MIGVGGMNIKKKTKEHTLPETKIALENQYLEDTFFFWDGLFAGASC